LDYGLEWEQAWIEHVATWQPPPRDEHYYITVKEANERQGPILDLIMSGNLRNAVDSYPLQMFTACVYWATDDDDHEVYHADINWKDLSDDVIMELFASDGSVYRYSHSNGYRKHSDKIHWPCTVVRHHSSNNNTYVVRIHQSPYSQRTGEMPWHRHKLPRTLYSYPRESIRYFKLPFRSDQHLPGVFRQPISIRGDIFPANWRNLVDKS
jgi:hypothetical protein